jgi:hypothetical protein
VGEDGRDLGLGGEDVLHDREALGAVEVGGLAGDDRDARAVLAMKVLKPWPRSRVAETPGMPSSSTTGPLPSSCSQMNSPALAPPATLSEAMK